MITTWSWYRHHSCKHVGGAWANCGILLILKACTYFIKFWYTLCFILLIYHWGMLVDMQEDSLQELSETELSEKNMKIFLSTDN